MIRFTLSKLAFLFASSLVVGCASLNTENIITEQTSFGAQHPKSVALNVGGGSSGVKWFSGTIDPEELEEAVQKSIEKTNLFSQVTEPASADYVLNIDLNYAGSHPGFTMTAWVTISWALLERASGVQQWSTEVKSEGKATVGDKFNGASRQFLALERSARANIDQALGELAALPLPIQ